MSQGIWLQSGFDSSGLNSTQLGFWPWILSLIFRISSIPDPNSDPVINGIEFWSQSWNFTKNPSNSKNIYTGTYIIQNQKIQKIQPILLFLYLNRILDTFQAFLASGKVTKDTEDTACICILSLIYSIHSIFPNPTTHWGVPSFLMFC